MRGAIDNERQKIISCFLYVCHIAGGILMSISLLFGGLAFTVITLKSEEVEKEKENEYEQKYIE